MATADPFPVLPGVTVVKVGGQSIIDRGRIALQPVLEEIVLAHVNGTKVLVCAGGGTRARSIYSLASELKLPTGILADIGARVPVQNARIIQTALARYGGVLVEPDGFGQLPLIFEAGCIPIMGGMPPYSYWEMRDPGSRIPPNRTDAGTFLTAEYVGCPAAIFVKDEDGLFYDDPKKNPDAEHIPAISTYDLADMELPDLVVERALLDYLPRAVWCRKLRIVNGLRAGETYRALMGQGKGSLIYAD